MVFVEWGEVKELNNFKHKAESYKSFMVLFLDIMPKIFSLTPVSDIKLKAWACFRLIIERFG